MGTSVALLLFLVASETAFSLSKDQDVSALAQRSNQFGSDIHRILATEDDANLLFSPLDILLALEMLCYGSRGKTADEMTNAFRYEEVGLTHPKARAAFKSLIETISKQSESNEYLIHFSNAVLTQENYPIVREYKDGLLQNYNATACDVDFQNEWVKKFQEINDWVELNTNDQTEKLLDDVDSSTIMVLLTAGYLKIAWKAGLDPKDTSEMVFYNKGLHGERTKVQTMHIVGEFNFARFGEGILLELPYTGEESAMIFYLPDAMTGAYEAERKFTFNDALAALKRAEMGWLNVSLPMLKLDSNTILNSVLRKLGIEIFENSADLTGINGEPTFVSKVLQNIFLQVSQEGCEASAITRVVTETGIGSGGNTVEHKAATEGNEEGSEPSRVTGMVTETRTEGEIKNIVFDRPFLLAITDKIYGFIYLQGRVCEL